MVSWCVIRIFTESDLSRENEQKDSLPPLSLTNSSTESGASSEPIPIYSTLNDAYEHLAPPTAPQQPEMEFDSTYSTIQDVNATKTPPADTAEQHMHSKAQAVDNPDCWNNPLYGAPKQTMSEEDFLRLSTEKDTTSSQESHDDVDEDQYEMINPIYGNQSAVDLHYSNPDVHAIDSNKDHVYTDVMRTRKTCNIYSSSTSLLQQQIHSNNELITVCTQVV